MISILSRATRQCMNIDLFARYVSLYMFLKVLFKRGHSATIIKRHLITLTCVEIMLCYQLLLYQELNFIWELAIVPGIWFIVHWNFSTRFLCNNKDNATLYKNDQNFVACAWILFKFTGQLGNTASRRLVSIQFQWEWLSTFKDVASQNLIAILLKTPRNCT